jgi:hypothetical protein
VDRRTFVGTLGIALLAAPLAVEAQQAAAIPRIGFLLMGSPPAGLTFAFEAFRKGLRELGWTENENIAIEYRWAGESPDRLLELATDLVRLKVDIIIGSTPGVRSRPGRDLLRHPGIAWLRALSWPVDTAVLDGEATDTRAFTQSLRSATGSGAI